MALRSISTLEFCCIWVKCFQRWFFFRMHTFCKKSCKWMTITYSIVYLFSSGRALFDGYLDVLVWTVNLLDIRLILSSQANFLSYMSLMTMKYRCKVVLQQGEKYYGLGWCGRFDIRCKNLVSNTCKEFGFKHLQRICFRLKPSESVHLLDQPKRRSGELGQHWVASMLTMRTMRRFIRACENQSRYDEMSK